MLLSFLGPLVGFGIFAAFVLLLGGPLLVTGLMATGRVRYRAGLAFLTLAVACVLASGGGNFAYNLLFWTNKRDSFAVFALMAMALFGSPVAAAAVLFTRSARRLRWTVPAAVLLVGTGSLIGRDILSRARRDIEERRLAENAIIDSSASAFVHASRDRTQTDGPRFLFGHARPAVDVTLLSNPLAAPRDTEMCMVRTRDYLPKNSDPAVLGDVTWLAEDADCTSTHEYDLAVVGRHTERIASVPLQTRETPVDASLFSSTKVTEGWREGGVPLSDMNLAAAQMQVATGPHGEKVFVVTAPPLHAAPSAFPCTAPGLLLSVGEVISVQAALAPCVLGYNLFTLDDDLFFAASVQTPIPPDSEAMNPNWTQWLLRVDARGVEQIWPKRGAR
ncbi:MAG: hypothetical protein ABTD50_16715 [Polyangiaceae bacterium]|jgi:hypothetical protein